MKEKRSCSESFKECFRRAGASSSGWPRGDVIRGKIGPAVGDRDVINKRLHRPVQVNVHATRVGTGSPRYVLLALPTWPADVGGWFSQRDSEWYLSRGTRPSTPGCIPSARP